MKYKQHNYIFLSYKYFVHHGWSTLLAAAGCLCLDPTTYIIQPGPLAQCPSQPTPHFNTGFFMPSLFIKLPYNKTRLNLSNAIQ